jgi:SAM-dependent methyltransferase
MALSEQQEIWDQLYKGGITVRYPWSLVISTFMTRSLFGDLRGKKVLEYGCGTAANLAFFADMRMRAFGFDFSEASIAHGAEALRLRGYDVSVAEGTDFDKPIEEGKIVLGTSDFQSFRTSTEFDYVLDRGALACVELNELPVVIDYIYQILAPGGLFVFTPFSDRDPSNPRHGWVDGRTPEPIGAFSVSYVPYQDLFSLLPPTRWSIGRLREISDIDPVTGDGYRHWLVVARKR